MALHKHHCPLPVTKGYNLIGTHVIPASATAYTPQSVAELAAIVQAAAHSGQVLTPWGAGTLQHLGRAPLPEAVPLYTSALNRIVEYNPADLTITVEAGAALGDIQAALSAHGQWLPWEPPTSQRATIGGLLAAGVSGPLRLGYGTPRDWLLGMRVVLGDGRLVKSGGKVVKNVAGYDTHKAQLGALGTLGVITEVTLKVAPLPEQLATLVFTCGDRMLAWNLAEQLRQRPLAPVSLVLSEGEQTPVMLLARFAGLGTAVTRQLHLAQDAGRALGAEYKALPADETVLLWQALAGFTNPQLRHPQAGAAAALVLRAGAPLAALAHILDVLRHMAPPDSHVRTIGYGGIGLAYARWYLPEIADRAVVRAVGSLRDRLATIEGYVVVEAAPGALREQLDLWGPPPATFGLMRALKARWDAQSVLNRGRYVGGI